MEGMGIGDKGLLFPGPGRDGLFEGQEMDSLTWKASKASWEQVWASRREEAACLCRDEGGGQKPGPPISGELQTISDTVQQPPVPWTA